MSIAELLPSGLSPSAEQTDALIELTYLVAAVDGRLADEELAAFGTIAARLRGKETTTLEELDSLLERFGHNVEFSEIEARTRELAAQLPTELHGVAYRLALGVAVVDHEPTDEEDRLQKVLGEALGLTTEIRAALSRQVALGGGKARMD